MSFLIFVAYDMEGTIPVILVCCYSPPVSAEQKTSSKATVIDDLKRDSQDTLSCTWNKALANQIKLTLREISASGYYLARLC